MKKLILALALLFSTVPAMALDTFEVDKVYTGIAPVCQTFEDIQVLVKAMATGDKDDLKAAVDTINEATRCLLVPGPISWRPKRAVASFTAHDGAYIEVAEIEVQVAGKFWVPAFVLLGGKVVPPGSPA